MMARSALGVTWISINRILNDQINTHTLFNNLVENGSHMMMITRANEINRILRNIYKGLP